MKEVKDIGVQVDLGSNKIFHIDLRYGRIEIPKSLFKTNLNEIYDLFKKWKIIPAGLELGKTFTSFVFYVYSPYFEEALEEFSIPNYKVTRLVDIENNTTLVLKDA